MIKQTLSKYLFLGALVIGVVPFAVEFVFEYRMSSMLRFAGIRNVQPWYWLFTSACLFSISASLLFPFREEESWECECGYDLSYSGNTSTRCPECGAAAQLEWTSKPGEFSVRTTRRIYRALLCFLLAAATVSLGIFIKIASS